jgi:phage gp45-like
VSGASAKDLAAVTDRARHQLRALVRRMAVKTATRAAAWLVTGARELAGDASQLEAEVFAGIGFYARPAATGQPEAIVLNIGADARAPVIVATRDHGSLKTVLGQLGTPPAAGEVLIYAGAGKAVVLLKADGTVEIRQADGTAGELATRAEVKALRDYLNGLLYGGTGSVAPVGMPDISGTTVLKGQ